MIKIIITMFIFCVILFFYLHIQFHLKTSDDLEIYEIEQASKDKMEEICDLRQPVLFDLPSVEDSDKISNTTNKQYLLDNYPVFEIKIRDNYETNLDSNVCVPLPLHLAAKLFDEDTNSTYFSEGNTDFLQETGAIKNMSYNDEFLRPSLVSNCYYDILMASANVETPFRYDLNYRNYYIVTQGSVKIKLSPPKSIKYLYPISDYENFEFKSPVNPWAPQTKYKADFDKIKCLEIILTPGRFLFIPAYWWYTFKFERNTSISCFKYRTYMNNIAITPKICMYALQNQNVERKIAKQIDIKQLQKQNKESNDSTSIDQLTNIPVLENNQDFHNEIPAILIPNDESMYNIVDSKLIGHNDNDNENNITLTIQDKPLVSSLSG